MNIENTIESFLKDREPEKRYSSFDYCYNYFYSFYKKNKISELANEKNIEEASLQIGFYLASWGMMRGSSFLLQRSAKNFRELIIAISKMDLNLWEIDVENYSEENIKILLDTKKEIIKALGENNNPSDTLVTKIMLGVFGNIPAFDRYFRSGLGVHSVNRKALLKIKDYYFENQKIFNSYKIHTFDFISGEKTEVIYTKAKLIDMNGFIKGLKKDEK